jgi:hypothetical protein
MCCDCCHLDIPSEVVAIVDAGVGAPPLGSEFADACVDTGKTILLILVSVLVASDSLGALAAGEGGAGAGPLVVVAELATAGGFCCCICCWKWNCCI